MTNILPYEIEIQLTNPNTNEVRSLTRTEYAYSLTDAMIQANVAVAAEAGSCEIKFLRIGPPVEAIRAVMVDAKNAINELMKRVTT